MSGQEGFSGEDNTSYDDGEVGRGLFAIMRNLNVMLKIMRKYFSRSITAST